MKLNLIAVVVIGCAVSSCVHPPTRVEPPQADVTILRASAEACGLHEKTFAFAPADNPYAGFDIRIDRKFGDPETKIDCALKRLPDDFDTKYGLGPMVATIGDSAPRE